MKRALTHLSMLMNHVNWKCMLGNLQLAQGKRPNNPIKGQQTCRVQITKPW